jgi:hypothetical protein
MNDNSNLIIVFIILRFSWLPYPIKCYITLNLQDDTITIYMKKNTHNDIHCVF